MSAPSPSSRLKPSCSCGVVITRMSRMPESINVVSGCRREPDPPARMIPFSLAKAEPLAIVSPRLHLLAPVAVLEVPACGGRESLLERARRRPPEFAADLRRLDRIAHAVDHLEVGPLVAAADVVFLTSPSLGQHQQHAGAVILDVQPVADVAA